MNNPIMFAEFKSLLDDRTLTNRERLKITTSSTCSLKSNFYFDQVMVIDKLIFALSSTANKFYPSPLVIDQRRNVGNVVYLTAVDLDLTFVKFETIVDLEQEKHIGLLRRALGNLRGSDITFLDDSLGEFYKDPKLVSSDIKAAMDSKRSKVSITALFKEIDPPAKIEAKTIFDVLSLKQVYTRY